MVFLTSLKEDSPHTGVGGVRLHDELADGIRVSEDRSSGEQNLELGKGGLRLWGPRERLGGGHQTGQGSCNFASLG